MRNKFLVKRYVQDSLFTSYQKPDLGVCLEDTRHQTFSHRPENCEYILDSVHNIGIPTEIETTSESGVVFPQVV